MGLLVCELGGYGGWYGVDMGRWRNFGGNLNGDKSRFMRICGVLPGDVIEIMVDCDGGVVAKTVFLGFHCNLSGDKKSGENNATLLNYYLYAILGVPGSGK